MLKWALIFFLVSLVAGFFGFTNVAAGARTIARPATITLEWCSCRSGRPS